MTKSTIITQTRTWALGLLATAGAPMACAGDEELELEFREGTSLIVEAVRPNTGNPHDWWVDTQLDVSAGTSLGITCADGLAGPWGGHPGFDCDGDPTLQWEHALAPTCPFGSLVGKIGENGAPFCVGSEDTAAFPSTGRLYLAFNDGVSFADNFGGWSVSLAVPPPPTPTGIPVIIDGVRANTGNPHDWWVDTSIDVLASASVSVSCDDQLVGPWGGHAGLDCNGDPTLQWEHALAPTCAFGSLVGKIGEAGVPFCLGDGTSIPAPDAGRLYLAFNDGVSFADNYGQWTAYVSVSTAPGPQACDFARIVGLGDESLNVREAPNLQAPTVGTLHGGRVVAVLDQVVGDTVNDPTLGSTDAWIEIDDAGLQGFVTALYTRCIEEPQPGAWVWPVPATHSIVQHYANPIDYQTCGFHTGIDIGGEIGDDVVAASDGLVVHVGSMWYEGAGQGRGPHAIIIQHGDGLFYSTYGHNSAAHVVVGQEVSAGQPIAALGSLGYSDGPHLHFEIIEGTSFTGDWEVPFADVCDYYLDPEYYVQP